MTDVEALAAFESLVLSQKPAEKPWEPVTDYSWEARKAIEGPHHLIIKAVFEPEKVIDCGCGTGTLLRLLNEIGIHGYGYDKAHGYQMIAEGVHSYPDSISERNRFETSNTADLVICREVLEHLTLLEIRQAVSNLCHLSSRYVYVTTRFHPGPQHFLDVATTDALDPTHMTMTNQHFLRMLFVLEGFKRRADLEERLDWMKKGRVLVYERAA